METNPLSLRPTLTTPTGKRPAPRPTEEPPKDQVQLDPQPPRTPKQLFAALRELGRDPGRDAAARMTGSLQAGYESLIKFQGEDGKHVSLMSQADLEDYLALVSGGAASSSAQQAFGSLQGLTQDGDRFYLKRGKQHLETDAAGAAVVLSRGEPVVRQRQTGELESWKEIPAEPERSSPERKKLAELLEKAEKLGFSLVVEPPERSGKPGLKERLKEALASKKEGVELRGQLMEGLDQGKRLLVELPEDKRKIPMALAAKPEQLEKLVSYLEAPSDEQKSFKAAFEALEKDQAVVMGRSNTGEIKGMLTAACDRSAYLQLLGGDEVVVLTKDGLQHRLTKPEQLEELSKNGKLESTPGTPLDPNQASDNLFMVYSVSPFDPINKGVYDDLLLRLTDVGSSPEIDIVAMHSDLPEKRNLRVDRVQPGALENLKKLDPETVMSDPAVFENFIFETLMANQSDSKVRLFVGGHGGAEKGLLPDGKHNNAAANHAMSVDDFAGAIHKALDRVEAETGKRPFIDNLMLCSCLMGNTSLIHALSETGDVGVLCASPEVMMGSNPNSVVEFLHDPKTSKSTGEEFARFLVDTISEAPSAPGGSKESHHADTYGAYKLDKGLAREFQDSLQGFFEVCLQHPGEAAAIKRAIAACPTYGINPFINLMFDVDNRDVIQVAERVLKDARVTSPEIKQACERVIKAAEAQVIAQKVSENYEGRRGPTMYLPIDRFDFDEKMASTQFLKGTDYQKFLEMVFDAPLHRGVKDTFLTEANRVMEAAKELSSGKKSEEAAKDEAKPEETKAEGGEKAKEGEAKAEKAAAKPSKEVEQVHDLEELRNEGMLHKLGRKVRGLVTTVTTVAGGLAGAAVGAVPGAVVGALLGLKAGISGHSLLSQNYGVGEDTSADTVAGVKKVARLVAQASLYPSEAVGLRVNEAVGFRAGSLAGRLAGGVAGFFGGALGGAVAGAAVGSIPGALTGRLVGRLGTFPLPDEPRKDHSQGLDSNLTVGE